MLPVNNSTAMASPVVLHWGLNYQMASHSAGRWGPALPGPPRGSAALKATCASVSYLPGQQVEGAVGIILVQLAWYRA